MDDLFSSLDQPSSSPRDTSNRNEIRRLFLGWDRPVLVTATAWLISQHHAENNRDTIVDLSNILAVVPGGRAARALEASLVAEAERLALSLFPPRIVTPGEIPESTLTFDRAVADSTANYFAWIAGVRSAAPRTLAKALGTLSLETPARAPAALTWLETHSLASSLLSLHSEISGHGSTAASLAAKISFIADDYAAARADVDRWGAIVDLASAAEQFLSQAGLSDRYAAIRDAKPHERDRASSRIVLIGVPELPRYVLDVLTRSAANVTALIAAPLDFEDHFDKMGCIIPEAWTSYQLRLEASSLRFVDSTRDQALAALDALADLGDSLARDEVVVAVPNTDVAPILLTLGERLCGQTFRDAAGTLASRAAPARLLDSLRAFIESRAFSALSSLIRHPDIEQWLSLRPFDEPVSDAVASTETTSNIDTHATPEHWLIELDEHAQKHIPTVVPGALQDLIPQPTEALRRVLNHLGKLLANFLGRSTHPLAEWMTHTRTLMHEIYSTQQGDGAAADPLTAEFLDLLDNRISAIESVPNSLTDALQMSAFDVLTYLASTISEATLSLPQSPGAIDLVGWLELSFDPARAVVIAGMNEGHVPASGRTNPLLPDRLRTLLRFPSAQSERARDLFLLAQLKHSRESLTLIAGRRSAQGDPLRPSRLLFACDPAEIPARVLAALARSSTPGTMPLREPEGSGALARSLPPTPFPTVFTPMPSGPIPEITSIRVTAFSDFLRSPYGFYLQHVLNLRERTEIEPELDAGAFGSTIHGTLHDFALAPIATSSNAAEIDAHLSSLLRARIAHEFGPRPSPAILVQTEHARLRLKHFAQAQAQRRAEGWRILHSEWSPTRPARFTGSGHSIQLRGRIDRVDLHEHTGQLAVLDYKTGAAKTTDADHRDASGTWKSLQLPLYRYLAAELSLNLPDTIENIALGYVRIGHTPSEIGFELANWTPEDLASADRAAAEVVRRVQASDFFHLGDSPPEDAILAAIAGTGTGSPPRELEADIAESFNDDTRDESP